MSNNPQTDSLTRSERSLLRILQVFAYLGIAATAISTLASALVSVISRGVPATMTLNNPDLLSDALHATAESWQGTVFLESAPWHLPVLFLLSVALSGGGIVVALFAVADIASRMLRGDTFASRAKHAFILAALGVSIAFVGNQLLPAVISMAAWTHLGSPAPLGALAEFNFWPLFLIAALGAASIAFRAGQVAKEDNEGLV